MTTVALIVCMLVATVYGGLQDEFQAFKEKYSKTYANEMEEKYRMLIFADNMYKVKEHNTLYELGLVQYSLAVNEYTDLLNSEFQETMTGYHSAAADNETDSLGAAYSAPLNASIPDEIDWRKLGAVTAIKNQGHCGSCWTFASTGALEGQHFRKTGKLVSLSEQNLVDCVPPGDGCNGGFMTKAFNYIVKNKGIDTEESYPYTAVDGKCRFKPETVGATCSGFVKMPSGDEAKLKQAVATIGPVCVAIDASHDAFKHYSSGVYYEEHCGNVLGHAVLVVGYGTTKDGVAYWLVKNSWGDSWGLQGYVMMARDRKNNCGIASEAIYPTV